MGAVNGKSDTEDEGAPPVSGIRVTDGLVRQLKGEQEEEAPARHVIPGGPLFPFYRPTAAFTPHASEDRKDSASGNEDSQPAHQAASWHADTSDRQSAAETSTSQQNTDHASQAMHEEVQELAEPKALKAEAASQQQVKQYADQLAEQYETPLKYLPCQEEKTSCLECYQHHQKDPLRCAGQVEAFTQCARRASAAMVS